MIFWKERVYTNGVNKTPEFSIVRQTPLTSIQPLKQNNAIYVRQPKQHVP